MKNNIGGDIEDLSQNISNGVKDLTSKAKDLYQRCKTSIIETARERFTSKNINKVCGNVIYCDFKNRRKTTYRVLGGLAILILASFIIFTVNSSYTAYSVEVDRNTLATVRNEEDFIDVLEEVKREALSLYGQEAVLDKEPVFIKTRAGKDKITGHDQIVRNIKAQFDIKLKATAIKINGEEALVVKDERVAHNILNHIKTSFAGDENLNFDSIEFVENIEIVETATDFSKIIDEEEALQLIAMGTNEKKTHIIEQGENTWTLALKYGLEMEDIMKANPGIVPERLQIGQEINLVVPKPLVSVRTKEYVELVEKIPFETEYEKTDALYKGDKKITVQGEEGQREIKGYIVKENGVEVTKEIMEEKILVEPKTRVIAEGIKERPATVATGIFANPTRGRLTSPFGNRWGRKHTGIDIGSSLGTAINAADAGRVSFSGRNGAYGNLVIIDHENGYQTYYAHNNRNLVKKGDRVYKGQKIAEMGSTGRSTGVHLHFEVRKNGTPLNPQGFVKY